MLQSLILYIVQADDQHNDTMSTTERCGITTLLGLRACGRGSEVNVLSSKPLGPGSINSAAILDIFILTTSAIHLITVVPACLSGLT